MPQTSNSSTVAYCTPQQTLLCVAPTIVADLLHQTNPDSPPPSYMAMVDPNNPACQKLLFHLMIGAGEIEAACGPAARYSPLDLAALTGVSQTLLQKINIARGYWSLAQSLKPLTAREEDVPMAAQSSLLLKELHDGIMIFSFIESAAAGLPSVNPPAPRQLFTPNVVSRAARLFPDSQLGQQQGRFQGGFRG